MSSNPGARTSRSDRLPAPLRRAVRSTRTREYAVRGLRTVLAAGAFDREWYEAVSGTRFDTDRAGCWHYLTVGRWRGYSPHPLFEPATAAPATYRSARLDPLVANLQGKAPAGGTVHLGLPAEWARRDARTRQPSWLAWAKAAGPDTPVPLTWPGSGNQTWAEFRSAAIQRAAELQANRALRSELFIGPDRPAFADLDRRPDPDRSRAASDTPTVSIVMPAWNRGYLIRRAVSSVLDQTLADWELIVVDDGSDDDTLLVLEGLTRHEPRIRVVAAAHGGVCRARNLGLAAARGRYVAFLDTDNVWTPEFLAETVRFADANDLPWAFAAMQVEGTLGRRYRAFEGDRAHLLIGNYIDLNVLLARRDAMERVGGFDESLRRAVDYDLVLRLTELSPPRLAPVIGAMYSDDEGDAQRISRAEPVAWNLVVAMRHLIDQDAQRRRSRVPGRTSILVPIRNQTQDAHALISELRATPGDVEIVVVVCGRNETLARALTTSTVGDPDITIVYWSADLGWAASIDLGATYATGEYLVAWRANCTPTPGWLDPLLSPLDDEQVAIVQPLTLQRDGRVSSAGAVFVGSDPFPSPLLGGFPVEDAAPLGASPVPAAYAGVLAMRADTFWRLGGVDPIYGNAFAEVDLSLRAQADGNGATVVTTASTVTASDPKRFAFGPDASASTRILRMRHTAPAGSAALWRSLSFEETGRAVGNLVATQGTPVEQGATAVVRPLVHDRPGRLRWAIDIAAPSGAAGLRWGDWHFAQSLASALRELGQQVHVDRRDARGQQHRDFDDVTLVLRGLDAVTPRPGGVSIMWVISHPDLVTEPEFAAYDHVFAASTVWADAMSQRWRRPVHPLLQCTDHTLFRPDAAEPDTGDQVVFVGTSRNILRPAVKHAVDLGLDLAVYGHGWEGLVPEKIVRSEYVPNREVSGLYASSGVVLNDHWEDMRHDGFISNRVFDVLASGGRLLSDDVAGLDQLFGAAVRTFGSEHDMAELFAGDWRARWPDYESRVRLAERVRAEHSFAARAASLLDAALHHHQLHQAAR